MTIRSIGGNRTEDSSAYVAEAIGADDVRGILVVAFHEDNTRWSWFGKPTLGAIAAFLVQCQAQLARELEDP